MSTDFSPDKFSDDYQDQLKKLIEAKLTEGDAVDTAATFGEESDDDGGGEVIDLVEALRRSVGQRGKTSTGAKTGAAKKSGAAKKTSAKKSSAKKATKKTTAKKSPARKSAAKKSPARSAAKKAS